MPAAGDHTPRPPDPAPPPRDRASHPPPPPPMGSDALREASRALSPPFRGGGSSRSDVPCSRQWEGSGGRGSARPGGGGQSEAWPRAREGGPTLPLAGCCCCCCSCPPSPEWRRRRWWWSPEEAAAAAESGVAVRGKSSLGAPVPARERCGGCCWAAAATAEGALRVPRHQAISSALRCSVQSAAGGRNPDDDDDDDEAAADAEAAERRLPTPTCPAADGGAGQADAVEDADDGAGGGGPPPTPPRCQSLRWWSRWWSGN